MGDLTKDFSISEVRCKCADCALSNDNPVVPTLEVMLLLQGVRDDLGIPLTIDAGVRCEKHNTALGGAKDSRHLPQYRDGIDIGVVDSILRYRITKSLVARNCRFIEVCPNHIHLDMRPGVCKLIIGVDH